MKNSRIYTTFISDNLKVSLEHLKNSHQGEHLVAEVPPPIREGPAGVPALLFTLASCSYGPWEAAE